MKDFIDQLRFGNPSKEDIANMHIENYLDKVIPELKSFTPPPNNSQATMEELKLLMEYAERYKEQGRKAVFDQSLVPYIDDLFIRNYATDFSTNEIIEEEANKIKKITQTIVDDLLPVITKLKYHFNRPRPFQLAYYYKYKLYPDYSYFVSSPSFPSGHTTMGTVICEVLGNVYPSSYSKMQAFMQEVAQSRLLMGVHFPSDNNMGVLIAQRILKNPEFRMRNHL